jgi:Flp pilus assembly protein TadB
MPSPLVPAALLICAMAARPTTSGGATTSVWPTVFGATAASGAAVPAHPWQWSAAAALLATAVLAMGGRPAVGRLRSLTRGAPPTPAAEPVALRRQWIAIAAVAIGALGGLLGGAAVGVVAGGVTVAAGWLAARTANRRSTAVDAGAADVAAGWELVAVGLAAGLPVAVAVSAAAERLAGSTGALLRRVGGLLELGADPAEAWRTVEHHPPLAAFARAAARSSGTGAALADVARAEAERLRAGAVDAAQERAQRAAVLITGPLGLCFLPAFMALGIAPVVVGLAGEALAQW